MQIREIDSAQLLQRMDGLCSLLQDCVNQGGSIGFLAPLTQTSAQNFWQSVAGALQPASRRMWLAEDAEGRVLGSVQLQLAMPVNGQHRAEVIKLMVAPAARRRGIARQLMLTAELSALQQQRSLLVLETRSDDLAEPLYLTLGFLLAGRIPAHAQNARGELGSTSIMYKLLSMPD